MASSSSSSSVQSDAERPGSSAPSSDALKRYPWITRDVIETRSVMTAADIRRMKLGAMEGCHLSPPDADEPVCASRKEGLTNFFFFYKPYLSRLRLHFPFTPFQMSCLNYLHLAPSQLHPNGWAYLAAFEQLCRSFSVPIPCTTTLFFFFFSPFTARSGKESEKRKGHTSLRSDSDRKLMTAFSDSFKHFKDSYFKVVAKPGQQPWFLQGIEAEDVEWKFPLYWTSDHHEWTGPVYQVASDDLPAEEVVSVDRLLSYVKTYGARSAAFFITGAGAQPGYVISMSHFTLLTASYLHTFYLGSVLWY